MLSYIKHLRRSIDYFYVVSLKKKCLFILLCFNNYPNILRIIYLNRDFLLLN